MPKASPTVRTLARLRKENFDLVEIVEHYNFFSKKRHDCFSILDIIAIKDKDTYGIQVTSYSNISARVKKITESPALPFLRDAGWTILVEGWKKEKNGRYTSKIVDLS
tara:strand:+ start:708 stop:1031 length:324 start_codon:yes stop_codon:yes gene_type:complete